MMLGGAQGQLNQARLERRVLGCGHRGLSL
jgi:hypothetical protein